MQLAVKPSARLPPLDPSEALVPWPGAAEEGEHEENDEL